MRVFPDYDGGYVCEHGIAVDVHCCNCHSGFLFDINSCACLKEELTMTRVVIESPLAAPTREDIEQNKVYAKRAFCDSLKRGEAPYASHLLFDQPGILDELDPKDRNLGLNAGLQWGSQAHLVAVYADKGISKGMQIGIDFYRHHSIPVEYRYLDRKDIDE